MMASSFRWFLFFFSCLTAGMLQAQSWQIPLERRLTTAIESHLSATDTIVQTSLKPFHYNQFDWKSVERLRTDDMRYFNLFEVKTLKEHLFEFEGEDFTLYIDPVLDLNVGLDFGDTSSWQDTVTLYNNTRGAAIYGRIGDRVSFHATAFENQTNLPFWLFNYTDSLGVIPGQGRWKLINGSRGRDYNSSTGLISIKAADWLYVHFGHGKHFIGNGYRSMLLSDVAFNYPYIRIQAESRNQKWRYTTVNAELNSLNRLPIGEVPESMFSKKGFSFRYLSYMPHPRIELGLYEGVIWQRWDSTGTQRYPAAYFTPLPVASALYGLDSTQNVVAGLNIKLKLADQSFLYGQAVIDQNGEGFSGYQAGIFLGRVFRNLRLRVEYNDGGEGLFTHRTPLQNYTHMNQGLAHPLGTNFSEGLFILRHERKRWWSELKIVRQWHDDGARGAIFTASDVLPEIAPEKGNTWLADVQLGYLLNPTSNMNALIGWAYRDRETESGHLISSFYYFGFRVALFNRYYDV